MVRSIQPEWIAGPVPPPRAREHINGIYAGYVIEKQNEKKTWHEAFRKPWEIGRHKNNFCGQVRTSRSNDHKYVHYLPGKEALDHHHTCLDETKAWEHRMLLDAHVKSMMSKKFACEKKRHYFNTMRRHEEEQRVLWSKAEKKLTKLAYINDEDLPEDPPRTRDLIPEFNPQRHFEEYIRHVKIGIRKTPGIFYSQYVNLPALGRYLYNLDSVKRGLLAELKNMPGKVPKLSTGKMGNFAKELELTAPSAEAKASALDLLEIPKFEAKVDKLAAEFRAKKALQPKIKGPPLEVPTSLPGIDDWFECNSGNLH
ncbi:hypothetical protein R1sor_008420 [Riccia sorocarpa]|uniref:Uncharacterized protein n=1 Tax=Riccia sorocarpa TaxID=122646 RepID=A0ABD3HWT0_9MARC